MGYLPGITIDHSNPLVGEPNGGEFASKDSYAESYLVAYSDHMDFARQVLKRATSTTANGQTTITRPNPVAHPIYTWMRASGIRFKHWAPDGSLTWSQTSVSVLYESPSYPTDGATPYLAFDRKFSGNFITIPYSSYFFPDGTPVDQNAGKYIPQTELVWTYYLLPTVDDATIDALSGKVNSTAFGGKDVGTVLFAGGQSLTKQGFDGTQETTLALSCVWRPVPWNEVLSPAGIFEVVTNAAGDPIYQEADLNPLLGLWGA